MVGSLSLDVLRRVEELEALVPEWQMLSMRDATATPFQRPEWLVPWWHHFGQPDLYVLRFRYAGELTGLLPLYVYFDVVRQERQLLLVGAGTSDYLGGVFAPTCTVEQLLAGLRTLADETTWDVAHLTQLRSRTRLYEAMAAQEAELIRSYAGESCSRYPASLIADLPKKVRADVRYHRNFAIGRGALTLRVSDAGSLRNDFELLVQQHTARWNEAGQPGVLVDRQVLAWHREALPLLLEADALRFYTLRLDDVVIATLYALIDPPSREQRAEYFYLIGHSAAHAELKPGLLLTAMASEHAVGEGVMVLDMLRGEEAYKRFWHVNPEPTFAFSLERGALARLAPR